MSQTYTSNTLRNTLRCKEKKTGNKRQTTKNNKAETSKLKQKHERGKSVR